MPAHADGKTVCDTWPPELPCYLSQQNSQVATFCDYNEGVLAIGVKQAKSDLSKLIEAALNGEKVVITNHGKAAVRLVPEAPEPAKDRGIGCLKGVTAYPHHWFSPEGEATFAALFEDLSPAATGKARRTKRGFRSLAK